jgi:hypothetical protein
MAAIFAALLAALANPAFIASLLAEGPELFKLALAVVGYIETSSSSHADPSIAAIGSAATGVREAMEAAAKAASDAAAHPNDDSGFDPNVFRKEG